MCGCHDARALLPPGAWGENPARDVRFLGPGALSKGRDELPLLEATMDTAGLPAAFDARTAWPQCESISDIWDQSNCGDCWAVATVTAAADRMCIATSKEGAGAAPTMTRLSVEHMVGCCRACGYGCGGGFPNYAWAWLAGKKGMPYGVVSGGGYQDYSWCSAYSLNLATTTTA